MGDRLFLDFPPLISATHLKYCLVTPYHIHCYMSISAIDCSSAFDTKQNFTLRYFTFRSGQDFLFYPKSALVFHSSKEFHDFIFEESVYLIVITYARL
jgi:hypothetical protein